MGFFKNLNKKVKKLSVWDIGLIKWSSIFFGAIIGAYIAGFVKRNLVWMIVITIALALKPTIKVFKKD